MIKKSIISMSIIILIGITLLGLTVLLLWQTNFPMSLFEKDPNAPLTVDEMLDLSVETEEIVTNLYSKDFIILQLSILLDNKKAKEEFQKRKAEVRYIIISELASKTSDELRGQEGMENLQEILNDRFNEILQDGKVDRVLPIKFQLQ